MESSHFAGNRAQKKWNLNILLILHIIAAILVTTLFSSVTSGFWQWIDISFFKMINNTLEGNRLWQTFWAMANHRNADWVEDVCIFLFFAAHIRSVQKGFKTRKIAEIIFFVLYTALVIFFINHLLFKQTLSVTRDSPSKVIDSYSRISDSLTWISVKESSSKSFPGDHGTTALFFAVGFSYLANRRLGILACIYAAFLCMPRMIAGAHWLTDVIIGSGSIVMLFLGWAFCTPLFSSSVDKIEGFLLWAKSLLKKEAQT